VTLADKQAAEAVAALLEAMRAEGISNGQIITFVEGGIPRRVKMADYHQTIDLK